MRETESQVSIQNLYNKSLMYNSTLVVLKSHLKQDGAFEDGYILLKSVITSKIYLLKNCYGGLDWHYGEIYNISELSEAIESYDDFVAQDLDNAF